MFNEIIKKINWNGSELELSTGKIARQADGAVMLKMGDAAILSTVVRLQVGLIIGSGGPG